MPTSIKDQIAGDLAKMLNSGVSNDGISELVRWSYSWLWSGEKNKNRQYEKCPFWSKKARLRWEKNLETNEKPFKGLRYEHVVPRSTLGQLICALRLPVQPSQVYQLLEQFCFACVICKTEEKELKPYTRKMPNDWNRTDVWARYKLAKAIEVWQKPNGIVSDWQRFNFP